jgi:predicted dehydrogenase
VTLAFASARELAHREEVDLVVVSVKVPHHHELVSTALDAGKMVMCEWPLGNGIAEARDLAAKARAANVRTAVGLQARSVPALRYLRDLVADGYVGEVLSSTLIASGRPWGSEIADTASRYLLDASNGATMLTISAGHTLDGVAFVLGELSEITATIATRRASVRVAQTHELLPTTAPDQIALTALLENGAVMSAHYRGGLTRTTDLEWEINGTDGDIVVTSPAGLSIGPVTIKATRDRAVPLTEMRVPAAYRRVPALADQENSPAYAVAHAYAQLLDDLDSGGSVVPDFDHAVRRHGTLEEIERAAAQPRSTPAAPAERH